MNNELWDAPDSFEGAIDQDDDNHPRELMTEFMGEIPPMDGYGDNLSNIHFNDTQHREHISHEYFADSRPSEQPLPGSTFSNNNQDAGYTSLGYADRMIPHDRLLNSSVPPRPVSPALYPWNLDPQLIIYDIYGILPSNIGSDRPALAPLPDRDAVPELPASNIQIDNAHIGSVFEDVNDYTPRRPFFTEHRGINRYVQRGPMIGQNPQSSRSRTRRPSNTSTPTESYPTADNYALPNEHLVVPPSARLYVESNILTNHRRTGTYGTDNHHLGFPESTPSPTGYGNSDFGYHGHAGPAYHERPNTQMGMGPGMRAPPNTYDNASAMPLDEWQYTGSYTQPQSPFPLIQNNDRRHQPLDPSSHWPNNPPVPLQSLHYTAHNAQQGTLAPMYAHTFHPFTPHETLEQEDQPDEDFIPYPSPPVPSGRRRHPRTRNGGIPRRASSTSINNIPTTEDSTTQEISAVKKKSKTHFDGVTSIEMTEDEFSHLRPNLPRLQTFINADPKGTEKSTLKRRVRIRGWKEVELLRANRAARGIVWKGPRKESKKSLEIAQFNQARYGERVERRMRQHQKQREMWEKMEERERQADSKEDYEEDSEEDDGQDDEEDGEYEVWRDE